MTNLPDNTKPEHGPTVVSDRAEIRKIINGAFDKFRKVDGERADAKTASDAENKRAIGEREAIITTLAAAAHAGRWSGDDVAAEIAEVIRTRNAKGTTLATFANEVKRACARDVRANVADLFRFAHAAWDAETAEIDAAGDAKAKAAVPKPMRKAFARCYHAVVQFAMKSDRTIGSPEEFVAFAGDIIRAREIDYKRVKGRLAAIVAELNAFKADFPVSGIVDCVEFLEGVTAEDLRDCVTPRPLVEDVPEAAPAPSASVDLDDMLGDALGDMRAAAD